LGGQINRQIIPSVKPFGQIAIGESRQQVKQAIDNFWDSLGSSLEENNFSWVENIQDKINLFQAQVDKVNEYSAKPFGNELNLIG